MAILVTPQTRVLVQGITGEFGGRHARASLDYGTAVVAGVTPGKGGQVFEHAGVKVPIFDTVEEAARETGATAAAIFVPPAFAADAPAAKKAVAENYYGKKGKKSKENKNGIEPSLKSQLKGSAFESC